MTCGRAKETMPNGGRDMASYSRTATVGGAGGTRSRMQKHLAYLLASCACWVLSAQAPAEAACSSNSPAASEVVTCDTSSPNPDDDGVIGSAGVTDVRVIVNAGSTLAAPSVFEGIAVHSRDTGWSVDNSGTISNTGDDGFAAIGLGYGGTVTNREGGLIVSNQVSSSGLALSNAAILIEGGPASVVNDGRIESNGNAINLRSGGSIINRGTIAGSVELFANGTIDNEAGALIQGSVVANRVRVTNSGTVDDNDGTGSAVVTSGEFINRSGGVVTGNFVGASLQAVIVFSGQEVPDGGGQQDGPEVVTQRRFINEADASITGRSSGAVIEASNAIVENAGTITGTLFNGMRVQNSNGTTVRNQSGGVIFGQDRGIRFASLFPSFQSRGSGTLTNEAGATRSPASTRRPSSSRTNSTTCSPMPARLTVMSSWGRATTR